MPLTLHNPVRKYAWGSRTVIPELLGVPPTGEPQAELWIGAHPGAPSTVEVDGTRLTLIELLEKDPEGMLGAAVVDRFGPRLPYLLKVLAIEQPLSIQAHPNRQQAEAGFAAEEMAGVPVDAPHRLYRDRSHKPEMVVALTEAKALVGFRPPAQAAALLDELGVPQLREEADVLRTADASALEHVTRRWLLMPDEEIAPRVAAVVAAATTARTEVAHLIVRLGSLYPADRGVLLALLMRYEELHAGDALFIPAGVPHAYLSGVLVEPQASSDNTLRAGLTPKHVDVAELARILRYDADGNFRVQPRRLDDRTIFAPPVEEFQLSQLRLSGNPAVLDEKAPRIVLITDGSATVTAAGTTVELGRGQAAFIPAAEGQATLAGRGTAFSVSPGAGIADTAR